MISKRIFLASSVELKDERQQFEILINRRNKQLVDQDRFLELIVWEDFLDAVSKTRLQDEYNDAIRQCDIFVMLFATKVGPYTEEEFEAAFNQFKATGKPLVFVYFKDAEISMSAVNKKDLMSVLAFQQKLDALGHFYTLFKNVDALKLHFTQQLEKLAGKAFFENDANRGRGTAAAPGGVSVAGANQGTINTGNQQINTGGGAFVGGGVTGVGGHFIGRDWIQRNAADDRESVLAAVLAAVARSAPQDLRDAALRQVHALELEVSKGAGADDHRVTQIIDDLAAKAPGAIETLEKLRRR